MAAVVAFRQAGSFVKFRQWNLLTTEHARLKLKVRQRIFNCFILQSPEGCARSVTHLPLEASAIHRILDLVFNEFGVLDSGPRSPLVQIALELGVVQRNRVAGLHAELRVLAGRKLNRVDGVRC